MNITARETEILFILEQNPMISQEELASQLNISRSAIAVHISNLIKKGKIIGRGYVLSQPKNIIVVGRIFASMGQEQPDLVNFNIKGLGYYVSKGLAKMGERVTIISALGDDILGKAILNELLIDAIDKKHLMIEPNLPTAMELVTDKSRVISPGALKVISEPMIGAKEYLFSNTFLAVNDCSFGVKQSQAVLNFCKKYGVDCISYLGDVTDITPFFSSEILIKMGTVIIKRKQLKQLGISEIKYEDLLNQNFFSLPSNGNIIIICEEEGVLIISKIDIKHVSLLPGQRLTNQFIVGFIYGLINGYNYSQAARIGLGNFQQS